MSKQLAASELLPEHSLLDKVLKKIVEKIYEAEKICEKSLREDQVTGRVTHPKCLENMHRRNFKMRRMNFQ